MRLFGATLFGLCLMTGISLAQAQPGAPAGGAAAGGAPQGNKPVASYGIGLNIGRDLKNDGVEVDLDALIQGLRDGLGGVPAKFTEEQLRGAFEALQQEMQAKMQQRNAAAGDKNKQDGEKFLAENKAKPGVTTTASGLQYQVLAQGQGPAPKATDTVKVHYEGKLLDGSVFDSSLKRNQPATFPVNGVIRGWTEALQLMHKGDKWRLFIPADLAYGPRGAGDMIGPHAVLTFEVELLDIVPGEK